MRNVGYYFFLKERREEKNLSRKEAMIELKDKVYNAMVERSEKESNYEYITYIKNEKKGE